MVDDLAFFREVLAKDAPTAGDLRRMSAQLRRILVDAVIEKIAGPRVGKIRLLAPVIDEVENLNREAPFIYVGVGHVDMFGVQVAMAIVDRDGGRALKTFHPDMRQELTLEQFMKQGVIVLEGTWVSRRDVLRYIANIAEGIHSGEPKNEKERLIRRARHVSKMSLEDDTPTVSMNVALLTEIEIPPLLSKTDVDGALIELWAAADLLTRSPDVLALEAYIETNG